MTVVRLIELTKLDTTKVQVAVSAITRVVPRSTGSTVYLTGDPNALNPLEVTESPSTITTAANG